MLLRVLFSRANPLHLAAGVVGSSVGLILLLLAIQLNGDSRVLLSQRADFLAPEYIVINKPVSFGGKNGFSPEEIEAIRHDAPVDAVVPFGVARFAVQFELKTISFMNKQLTTMAFLESLPDAYLDFADENWRFSAEEAEEGNPVVPLAIPRHFLTLFNFGFAASQGIPAMSEETVKFMRLDLKVGAPTSMRTFPAKIAGISDRLNTILVPDSFLSWANDHFGYDTMADKDATRLLLVAPDPSSPKITEYLEEHGYEAASDKVKNSRLTLLLRIAFAVLATVAGVIIALAFLVFVLAFQQLITRSREELRTLLAIGYSLRYLTGYYFGLLLAMLISILALAFPAVSVVKHRIYAAMIGYGFEHFPAGLSWNLALVGVGLGAGLLLLNTIMVRASLHRFVRGG